MRPKKLFRARLDQIINLKHQLAELAEKVCRAAHAAHTRTATSSSMSCEVGRARVVPPLCAGQLLPRAAPPTRSR
jgi:hypothetical protein